MSGIQIKEGDRYLRLRTPLGPDELILTRLEGEEAVSGLFRFRFEMVSPNDGLGAKDLLGKRVTGIVRRPTDEEPRYFSGMVTSFGRGPMFTRNYRYYACEIRPWFWFLTKTTDCRIFQDRDIIEIAEKIFGEHGFSDYDFGGVKSKPPKRTYCVQYRETDYDFISRLFAEEGLYYYFKHEDQKHTLMVADSNSGYGDTFNDEVPFRAQETLTNVISRWQAAENYITGTWTQRDYDFMKPSADLTTTTKTVKPVSGLDKWEIYDYPGRYFDKGRGDGFTRKRMELSERDFELTEGESDCPGFYAGAKFTLSDHEVESEKGTEHALTRVTHLSHDYTQVSGDADPPIYRNSFVCMPADVVFRPDRPHHKPVVVGPQTAVVVGPSGEEIYTDEHGRVKVQFHWDREGKKDEKSSCWVRVSQPWAGRRWGGIFIPRIGMEVIVDFFEGDADRPIITGYVYNGENPVPYELPANKTQSGFKTRSSKNGGESNFNELRFEDKKGEEQVYVHAEKNMDRVVENDDTLDVGHDQTIEIERHRTETVKTGNETVDVDKGNRTITLGQGNDKLHLKMGNHTTKIDLGKSEHEAMQSIELKVGQSSVKLDQSGVTIKGLQINIKGQVTTNVEAVMTTVKGSGMLTLQGGIVKIN
jgi:type VI secretion system secreted protein VgrG